MSDGQLGLPEALERAASALPADADEIRPANGDPVQLRRSLDEEAAHRVLSWLLLHEPAAGDFDDDVLVSPPRLGVQRHFPGEDPLLILADGLGQPGLAGQDAVNDEAAPLIRLHRAGAEGAAQSVAKRMRRDGYPCHALASGVDDASFDRRRPGQDDPDVTVTGAELRQLASAARLHRVPGKTHDEIRLSG